MATPVTPSPRLTAPRCSPPLAARLAAATGRLRLNCSLRSFALTRARRFP